MRMSPKDMPAGMDGQAHLFFSGNESVQFIAISTTGCIAVQSAENPVRVFHWYFRSKNAKYITLPPVSWAILWSCRAPWNTQPCGHITQLHANRCGLTSIDARELTHLTHLRCAGNPLERLDCSGLASLKSLDCSGNELISLNVDGCRSLSRLRVGGNHRLHENASELICLARGEPTIIRRPQLMATSLFDL